MIFKRKILILSLFIFSLFFCWQTNALLSIKKDKLLVLNYSKSEKVENMINSWELRIYLNDDKWVRIIDSKDNKKVYFEVYSPNYESKWKINIKLKEKLYKIDYEIELKIVKNWNDITKLLKQKSIQKRPLSCESAAAADIITYFTKKSIDEYKVFDLLKKDMDYKSKEVWGIRVWWNPNKGFVGHVSYYWSRKSIKPFQRLYSGYWVYEKPIWEVFDKFGLNSMIINKNNYNEFFDEKDHLKLVLESLDKGKMVQLWGDWCTDSKYEDWTIKRSEYSQFDANQNKTGKNYCSTFYRDRTLTWYYYEDWKLKKHIGLSWEHAFILLGYEWYIDNPEKIIVWDTDTGYHKYPIKEWMRKWKMMNYRSIIVSKVDNNLVSKK